MKLSTRTIQRNFKFLEGKFYTESFQNLITKEIVTVENCHEFIIYLINGTVIQSSDMTANLLSHSTTHMDVQFSHDDTVVIVNYAVKNDVIYKSINIKSLRERMNYIDCESFEFSDENGVFETKKQKNNDQMGDFEGFYFECGQPAYAKSLFFGMEFPMAENRIEANHYFSRYYYGKHVIDELVIHPTIVGACESYEKKVLQKAFFKYLDTIQLPVKMRKQYSSWYDHMLAIDEEKLVRSFKEIDAGFKRYGIQLDAFVVDDGWTNYESVWEFNHKFPNGLTAISDSTKKLGATLGLWIGPRGGYNGTQIIMSDWLEKNKHLNIGSKNKRTNDVNVADFNYLALLKQKMLDYQKTFDISSWKIDGLLKKPDVDDESGLYGMHTMTAVYEFLIQLFIDLRQERNGRDCHLNLTSYVNPSPWFLKWVNSVWIQISTDVGFTEDAGNDFDRMLTYRDSQYYEFSVDRAFQFPYSGIYNHEPIYGETTHTWHLDHRIYASIEQFKEYLLFISTRGNTLWEFYYSYTMFDEQRWKANAQAISWISEHYSTLKNSHIFGNRPKDMTGIYGYQCESDDKSEMILSFRNPGNESSCYTINHQYGVDYSIVSGREDSIQCQPNCLSVHLEPKEILIVTLKK